MTAGVSSTWWTRPVVVAAEGGDGSALVLAPPRDINSVEGRPWMTPCGCWDDSDCPAARVFWDLRQAGKIDETMGVALRAPALWRNGETWFGVRCRRWPGPVAADTLVDEMIRYLDTL